MCFFISFFPATFWAVIGYFVWYSSTRAEGKLRALGQLLGAWALVLAGFILLAGAYVSMSGLCTMEMFSQCWSNGAI